MSASRPAVAPTSLLAIPAFRRLLMMQVSTGLAYSAFLILPKQLAVTFGANPGEIGFVMGAFGLANVLAAPLVYVVRGRLDRRVILGLANVAVLAASLGFLAVDRAGALAAGLRAVQGAAWALIFSAGSNLAVAYAPPGKLSRAITLHSSSNLVTNALGLAAAEPLLAHVGPAAVFVFAAASSALAITFGLLLPPEPQPITAGPLPREHVPLPRFPLVASVVLGLACSAMFTFHQPLALERGATRVADFLIAYTAVAIAVRLAGASTWERWGPSRVAFSSLIVYGAVVAAMPALDAENLAFLGALFGVAHGFFYPALITLALQDLPLGRRDAMLAWANAAFHAGAMGVAPLGVVGRAAGYPAVFLPVAALLLLTAAGFRRRPR